MIKDNNISKRTAELLNNNIYVIKDNYISKRTAELLNPLFIKNAEGRL